MGVPGVTCSAKRKSNRWLVGAAVLVLLLATAHAEEAAAGVADADVKADADADAGATPDTVELLPPEQPQLKQDKRAEERFNATDAAGALEGDGDGEAGDVEGVAPEASTPPTVLVESGDGEEATDTSAPTGKAETATASSSVPAPTGEDAGGGAGGDARQTMDDTTGDAGDGLQDGEEEGGEEGDEQGDGEEDQYGEEEGYGEGVGDVGGEGMEDEDEGEAGDGDGNLDGRGAEVDEDADEYEPPQTRRDMGYNPNRWRGAPSTHPDEVFRASYQPSHILTFRVKAGHAETFFADVEAGAVVRGDFFVAKGGAYSLDVKISSPSGTKLFVKHGALSGIFMFTAKETGVYTAEIRNTERTFSQKQVSFAWLVGADSDDAFGTKPLAQQEQVKPLGKSVHRIHQRMDAITSALAYQNVRYQRNVEVEENTHTRIMYSTLLEMAVLLGVSWLQIRYIRRIVNSAVGWV